MTDRLPSHLRLKIISTEKAIAAHRNDSGVPYSDRRAVARVVRPRGQWLKHVLLAGFVMILASIAALVAIGAGEKPPRLFVALGASAWLAWVLWTLMMTAGGYAIVAILARATRSRDS
jgi:hypothetical protein